MTDFRKKSSYVKSGKKVAMKVLISIRKKDFCTKLRDKIANLEQKYHFSLECLFVVLGDGNPAYLFDLKSILLSFGIIAARGSAN